MLQERDFRKLLAKVSTIRSMNSCTPMGEILAEFVFNKDKRDPIMETAYQFIRSNLVALSAHEKKKICPVYLYKKSNEVQLEFLPNNRRFIIRIKSDGENQWSYTDHQGRCSSGAVPKQREELARLVADKIGNVL